MKKFLAALLVLTTSAFAAEVTVLETNLPITQGYTSVDTKFYIDTEMKEGFAKVAVDEQYTVMVQQCNYGGGYPGPGPIPGRGYPRPFPGGGTYCRSIPQTMFRTVLTDKVKIEGMTMNGDEVIYQGAEGTVVCGTMKRSRILRVPTLYLSGKCELVGRVVRGPALNDKLVVTFKTK